MLSDDGYEWGLIITRRKDGLERDEYHRHYNEATARAALIEERHRIARGVTRFRGGTVIRAQLARRAVGPVEVIE